MGLRGGITAAEARTEIIKQTFEYLSVSAAIADKSVPLDTPVPPTPANWAKYHQVKNLGHLWWEGGLADQPFWLMLELDSIETGIDRFERMRAAALAAIAKMQSSPNGPLSSR